ncbi:MAG: hypothetical protein ACI4QI_05745 [Candidatus Coproplasma sp.]
MCFTVSACGNKYTSNYSATLMVKTNTANEACVSFDTFSGTYVMKFNNKSNSEAIITYNITLKEGKFQVYYDYDGNKLHLFEIENNFSTTGNLKVPASNNTIYIIIESEGKCTGGNCSFILVRTE